MSDFDMTDLKEEKADIKNIQVFANKFALLTPEEEKVLTKQFWNLKFFLLNSIIPYKKKSYSFLPTLLSVLVPKLNELGDELINRNLRLVIHSAQSPSYTGRGLAIFDLFMEGFDGLKYAIWYKYNPHMINPKTGRTNKLSTYCTFWIKQRIGRSIEKKGSAIKIAGHIQSIMSKIRQVVRKYVAEFQSKPGPDTIVLLLHKYYPGNKSLIGINAERVSEYGRLAWQITSLDEINNADEGSSSVGDFLSAPASYEPEVMHEEVERRELITSVLDSLDEDSRFIITWRFGIIDSVARSSKSVAKLMGLHLKDYNKKEMLALEKFKKLATEKELNQYY